MRYDIVLYKIFRIIYVNQITNYNNYHNIIRKIKYVYYIMAMQGPCQVNNLYGLAFASFRRKSNNVTHVNY